MLKINYDNFYEGEYMKYKKQVFFTIIFIFIFTVLGCALRRIPDPTADLNMPGGGSRITPHSNYSPGWDDANNAADNIEREIIAMPGVMDASVVIYNTSAYVGAKLEGKENMKDSDMEENRGLIDHIAKRVKETEGMITTIYVSTDNAVVQRLSEISGSIKTGKTKGNFKNEIDELMKNIKPIE